MNSSKKPTDDFDWKAFEAEAARRLAAGEELAGPEGVLTPLIKRLLEASLEGEIQAHVDRERPNRRNGRTAKQLKTSHGPVRLEVPRDREGTFNSELVPKRRSTLGEGLDNKILALYGLGMSYSDIRAHLAELYGLNVSEATLSSITDKVMEELERWQRRQLDPVYPFVWLDALHYKVRHEGRVVTRALYTVLALDLNGRKDLLGLYVGEAEGARFWLGVLSELQQRGVRDILIASIDNLNGFAEAIETIYTQTDVQLCLVHQMRNSLRYVAWADYKAVSKALKGIYRSATREQARQAFEQFTTQWGRKYPMIVKSWQTHWERLTRLFDYPPAIRRIIYTTNPVEAVHRQLRKVTKTKGAFINDRALVKLLYLAYKRISAKWTSCPKHWGLTLQQLHLLFPDRLPESNP